MKALVIGKKGRFKENMKRPEFYNAFDLHMVDGQSSDEEKLSECRDADIIIADAIAKVSKYVIDNMPNLKLIHSEGVGYNGIDTNAARERGIPVCNCKGMNSRAVAEQTILLTLGLLRGVASGDKAFRDGRQILVKEDYMKNLNLKEISDLRVGLLGFGDIAKEAAKAFNCFGADVSYYDIVRPSSEIEKQYDVTYKSLEELAQTSDLISIHVAVTPKTEGMINKDFLSKMPRGSYLINTARGEIVNEPDLIEAVRTGQIAGAGLDTVSGEPVSKDNIFLNIEDEVSQKILFSCHVGGITASAFKRSTEIIFNNCMAVANGGELINVVNDIFMYTKK